MALTADQITAQNFKDFYTQILPYLNKGNGGTSDTPLGQVAFFDDLVAPYGWLVADGSTYNIADYPDLANQYERVHGSKNFYGGNGTTTFAVPNWQGEFLRASGTNSHANQGGGGTVGAHQDATVIPKFVVNPSDNATNNLYVAGKKGGYNSVLNADKINKISSDYQDISINKSSAIDRTGDVNFNFTSRPTNTSLLLCIKAIPSSEMNTYSLTERRVGTWIDGKPLYEKTIVDTIPSDAASVVEMGNISTILGSSVTMAGSYISIIEGHIKCTNNAIRPMGTTYNAYNTSTSNISLGNIFELFIRGDGTLVSVINSETQEAHGGTVYATIQYTKTTDV